MKFALFASSLSAAVASVAAADSPSCNNGANCYAAVHGWGGYIQYEPYQGNLMEACRGDDNAINGEQGFGNLFGNKACVAVAVSSGDIGPSTVQGLGSCDNQNLSCLWAQPSLDYNIYAGIVGDCAWQPDGCPITQQNFIDFIYSALSDIGSADWPSSTDTLISNGWQPLLGLTNSTDTISYNNLNLYLHGSKTIA
ncbi:hypothetical protein K523DRAFT_412709 [Schizophyllum commune Tattone D]|nr:hypothetical protein K523DRAFT_412709 [Schizophyllum commune Tattone D]